MEVNKQDRRLQKSHASGLDLDLQDAWWLIWVGLL